MNLAQAALEKPAFAGVGDERAGAGVALGGFGGASSATQQICAGGVQEMMIFEIAGSGQPIDDGQRGLSTPFRRYTVVFRGNRSHGRGADQSRARQQAVSRCVTAIPNVGTKDVGTPWMVNCEKPYSV